MEELARDPNLCEVVIPSHLKENVLDAIFSIGRSRDSARKLFLERCFSADFLRDNDIKFDSLMCYGFTSTAKSFVAIRLVIGNDLYAVTIPMPHNVTTDSERKRLAGRMKFCAERIDKEKSPYSLPCHKLVQEPTYDWKECFDAIEADVAKEEGT